MKIVVLSIILWFFSTAFNSISTSFPPNSKIYFFTGSDWCSNCKKMHHSLFEDSSFTRQLETMNLSVEIVDFPRKSSQSDSIKTRNAMIAEQLNFTGKFPAIYIRNGNSNEVIEIEYGNENRMEFLSLLMKLNQ